MELIAHRELRNNSAEVLQRVKQGETIGVTNNGELTAVLSPPGISALDHARQAGRVRLATAPREDRFFSQCPKVKLSSTTQEVLADVRGDR